MYIHLNILNIQNTVFITHYIYYINIKYIYIFNYFLNKVIYKLYIALCLKI